MKIGLSFNYWMAIIPVLFAIGAVLGYWSVWPSRRRAMQEPFGFKGIGLSVALVLGFSLGASIATFMMLYTESRFGFIELMGRDLPWSKPLAYTLIFACGVAVFVATAATMIAMRRYHAKRLSARWQKKRARSTRKQASPNKTAPPNKVVAMPVYAPSVRRRVGVWQRLQSWRAALAGSYRRFRLRCDPMVLPEQAVQHYKHSSSVPPASNQ